MEEQQIQKKKNLKKQGSKGLRDFGRYSNIAFQMVAIILITTWGGKELDKLAGFEHHVFLIILSLLGVFAAIYTAVRDFLK
ncbi:MAG: AtpZ/AtpI family protein [Bacteroidales bacterium]|nr:AtpZ/AtpI family protein [Bacteroidales bacterium]